MKQRVVAVDFDGVLNTFSGTWVSPFELHDPRPDVAEFLEDLSANFRVVVFTTRSVAHVLEWLLRHDLWKYVDDVTNVKPVALCYIDDRALKFEGNFIDTLRQVDNFHAYWEQPE